MLIFQWHSNLCLHYSSDPETLQDGREGPVYVLQHPFVRAGRHFHQRLHPLFQCTQVQTDHVQEVTTQQRQRLYGGQWRPSGTYVTYFVFIPHIFKDKTWPQTKLNTTSRPISSLSFHPFSLCVIRFVELDGFRKFPVIGERFRQTIRNILGSTQWKGAKKGLKMMSEDVLYFVSTTHWERSVSGSLF